MTIQSLRTVDVCVVGAGPSGCYAAFHLARAGCSVRILEEHAEIGEPVDCSGVLGTEAFEWLDLPREAIRDRLERIELVSPSGRRLVIDAPGMTATIVDRAAFDRSLAGLAEGAGVDIQTRASVTGLRIDRDAVRVSVRSGEERTSLSARTVILAGGPRYRFQQQLGMGRPSRYLKTIQTEVELPGMCTARVFFGRAIAPGSFAWFLPVRQGSGCVGKLGVSATGEQPLTFQPFLDHLRGQGLLNGQPVTPKGWVIPIQPIPRTFAERIVAVGDAAGQTKPTTGGGLYYGLMCARIAADTLVEALRAGDCSPKKLSLYERRWKELLGPELRTARVFRWLIERLSDRDLDRLFGLALQEDFTQLIRERAKFDWHREVIQTALWKPRFSLALLRGVLRLGLLA